LHDFVVKFSVFVKVSCLLSGGNFSLPSSVGSIQQWVFLSVCPGAEGHRCAHCNPSNSSW